ncbi:acyltransferase family protein [Paraburkholderia bannensis]|uniref:acyltransferase family protein n=1 Tax=Paraburkholderia bannensis TaxID=765414 RepID=UPI002ABD49B0|nr:acyltransferase [Paraburkholderia bannensis]
MIKRNFGLDVVRTCAILPVMAEHFFQIALHQPPSWLWPAGGWGVSLFFVLSGFLIGGIILRNFEPGMAFSGAKVFYQRRWMRTIPLYWTFLGISVFTSIAGFGLAPEVNVKCLLYIPFLQNLAWPLPAGWYQESWSLAVEEWFYLLFPLLFIAIPFASTRARVIGVAAVMTFVSVFLRILVFVKTGNTTEALQSIVFLKLDGIAAGIFSVLLWQRCSQAIRSQKGFLCTVGILGSIACYLFVLGEFGSYPWLLIALWPTATSAFFCMAMLGANSIDWKSFPKSLAGKLFVWTSTRSYALYLCHGVIIRLMLGKGYMWQGLQVSIPMFLAASILIAEFAHQAIEKPLMRIRPRELSRLHPVSIERTDA